MSIERAAMQGRLAEARMKRDRLKAKAEGLCTSLRQQLNTALTPVEEIEIDQVDSQASDLTMTLAELQSVRGDIARLERELR